MAREERIPTDAAELTTTLLRGGWVAAWDGNEHQVIGGGEVAFRGTEIIYAGPHYQGHADVVQDRPEWFICPGFINLHAHVGVELIASLVDLNSSSRLAIRSA